MMSEKDQGYGRGQPRSLHGPTKSVLRILGIVLLIIGIILAIVGLVQQGSKGMEEEGWFETASGGMIMTFAGMAMVIFGFVMLYVSFIGRVAKYYADESAPAIETASGAVARGLSKGTQEEGGIRVDVSSSATAGVVIKTKCRNCGYLETEDADFCSKCGKRL